MLYNSPTGQLILSLFPPPPPSRAHAFTHTHTKCSSYKKYYHFESRWKFPSVPVAYGKTAYKYLKSFSATDILDSRKIRRRHLLSEDMLFVGDVPLETSKKIFGLTYVPDMSVLKCKMQHNCSICIHKRQLWFTNFTAQIMKQHRILWTSMFRGFVLEKLSLHL